MISKSLHTFNFWVTNYNINLKSYETSKKCDRKMSEIFMYFYTSSNIFYQQAPNRQNVSAT